MSTSTSTVSPVSTHPSTVEEPTTVEKLRGLPWSIAANSANTVFVQFTFFGSVFVLFLNQLGLSKTDIGFMLSFMPFAGILSLFVAPAVARFGYKRTFLTFYGIRKGITALLLLTPWVIVAFGTHVTILYIGVITAGFAICRAIAETGRFPWTQEMVPSAMQGKYTATNNMFTTIAGFLAVTAAGLVVERATGISGFMVLIGVGVVFGAASVWLMSFVPGGAPRPLDEDAAKPQRDLTAALADRDFLRYLAGAGLIIIVTTPLNSFIPLYMQDVIGLTTGTVVYLQSATLLASMLTSYMWGWAADRYGSKPVMLSGVILLFLLPVFWLFMPKTAPLNLVAALSIAFVQGVANMGWAIGSARLLFVGVVPREKKSDYMALYFAFIGVTGGMSQLFSGRILDYSQGLNNVSLMGLQLNSFVPLFVLGLVLPIAAIFTLRRVREDEALSTGQFVGIFFKGNPFMAIGSLIRYNFVVGEDATVEVTANLGQARSALAINELLQNLEDPRFNVRFEAIIAISRLKPNERLTEALVRVVKGPTPALSVVAAWALGRMGAITAIEPLREGLHAPYRSVQAYSARALGTLGDTESIPVLLERLLDENEPDTDLRMAYASSLGKLGVEQSADEMLNFLHATDEESIRRELSLAIARIVGDEAYYIQLQRHMHDDPGTAMSQAVTSLRKGAARFNHDDLAATLTTCAHVLAHENLVEGATLLSHVTELMAGLDVAPASAKILQECTSRLREYGPDRIEYLILALHTLNAELPS